jgi:methionyl-tRNA formyltransferase
MKLIFMGTPDFAVPSLDRLIEAGHWIEAVLTQPDRPVGRKQIVTPPPVKVLAMQHGLKIFQPEKIRTAEARAMFEPILRSADAGIVAAYGRILPDWMLAAPRFGCINVHSSILPKYRGAAPINWAIVNGESETGVTIMQMDSGLDTGAILLQESTSIGDDETAEQLTPRLAQIGARLLVETLKKLESGELKPIRQNDTEATLAPILKREDGLVDWNLTARQIINRKRGFTPFPGCYTNLNGHRLEIVKATEGVVGVEGVVGNEAPQSPPGTVIEISKESLCVACGNGTKLLIFEVQPAGKRAMMVRDFLNGIKLSIGDRLG